MPELCAVPGSISTPQMRMINVLLSQRGADRKAIGYNDSWPEPLYQKWIAFVVAECLRVAKGLVWINHKGNSSAMCNGSSLQRHSL